MTHTIEPAASGRSRCRGCGHKIDKDQLRLGERVDNPYGEGDRTLWFHLQCAAYKRPEPFLAAIETAREPVDDLARLRREAEAGIAHRRLVRIDGAHRSPTGRARCRSCRELIEKDSWRISLVYWEAARFEPSGFLHAHCAQAYFGTTEILPRIAHFAPELGEHELDEIRSECGPPSRSLGTDLA